jgi:hypothetical protein
MKDQSSNYPRENALEQDGASIRLRHLASKSTGWAGIGVLLLFVLGMISIALGDGAGGPFYHGGGLLLFSIPFLFGIWLIGLAGLAKVKLRRLASLPVVFLFWSLLGFGILCAVEVWSKGSCCSNRVLRGQISDFSILWPSTFICISVVDTLFSVYRSRRFLKQ